MKVKITAKLPAIQVSKTIEVGDDMDFEAENFEFKVNEFVTRLLMPQLNEKLETAKLKVNIEKLIK